MFDKRKNVRHLLPLIIIDIICIFSSYWIAFLLRFLLDPVFIRHYVPAYYVDAFRITMPWMTLICLGIFAAFRFYSTMWEFASTDELIQILIGTTVACAVSTVFSYFVFPALFVDSSGNKILRFPQSVYVIGWLLTIFFVGGYRFLIRIFHRKRKGKSNHSLKTADKRVMVVGAGEMGSMVIKEMKNAPQYTGVPVIAIDDDVKKRGTRIHGVRVVGGRESIPRMAAHYRIDEIILAIPTAKQADKQDIIRICSGTGCRLKTVPALYELLEEDDNHLRVRDVDILDLLGRDEVKLDIEEISGYLKGKTIIVTGGGGTIGSELCRQIACFHPKKLIVFEIYENNAYMLQDELKRRFPWLDMEIVIGSIRDRERLEHVFSCYRPDVVFHAAAHKHVPLMELSPGEAVKNNVFGTLNVAQVCDQFHVKRMVLISTDKAVNPTSIMGATKRICELIIQYYSRHSKTGFVSVRFGNVLGSSGSVIPIFKRQIAEGGPVLVTDPNIVRYFMTIPEAARLVIQAGGMAKGGEIFVLDMGKPVKIVDLARNLIRLSGYEPDVDIKIEFTGLRPGEKLYEEMLLDSEGGCKKTAHELIYIGNPIPFNEETFIDDIEALRSVVGKDNAKMLEIIHRLVPTYTGHAEKTDLLVQES
jgi:FlaA1/EpsC-like NDP-sugar epimerase